MKQTIESVTPPVIFLKGKKTILRPVRESDIPYFLSWINDPEIRPFILRYAPLTEGEEQEWLAGLAKKSDTDIILVIEVKGQPIGSMGIHRIDWINRIATTGAVIGDKRYWGKGYGTDAKMMLLNYAFNTLNMRKMMSATKAFNARSLAYSKHCGYKVEGCLRKQFFVDGEYHDDILLGLFKEEWLPYWRKYRKG